MTNQIVVAELLSACQANVRTLDAIASTVRAYHRGEKPIEHVLDKVLDLALLTDQSRHAIVSAEIEAILSMSDTEILDDCRANGGDPEKIAAECLALFEHVVKELKAKRGEA